MNNPEIRKGLETFEEYTKEIEKLAKLYLGECDKAKEDEFDDSIVFEAGLIIEELCYVCVEMAQKFSAKCVRGTILQILSSVTDIFWANGDINQQNFDRNEWVMDFLKAFDLKVGSFEPAIDSEFGEIKGITVSFSDKIDQVSNAFYFELNALNRLSADTSLDMLIDNTSSIIVNELIRIYESEENDDIDIAEAEVWRNVERFFSVKKYKKIQPLLYRKVISELARRHALMNGRNYYLSEDEVDESRGVMTGLKGPNSKL